LKKQARSTHAQTAAHRFEESACPSARPSSSSTRKPVTARPRH
jgi:hypothetical protein